MRLIHAENMDLIKSISDLCISPDGKFLAFCLESACVEENRYRSFLYSYELSSGRLHCLDGRDTIRNCFFDQNGMVIYTWDEPEDSALSKSTKFWEADPVSGATGEAFSLPLPHARAALLKGERLVISAVWDLELEKLKAAGDERAVEAHLKGEIIVCDEYPYRIDGQGYVNKKRNRLYEYNRGDGSLVPVTPPDFQTHDYAVDEGRLYVLGEDYQISTAQRYSVYCWENRQFRLSAMGDYMFSALAVSGDRIFTVTDTLPDDVNSYIYTAKGGDRKLDARFKTRYTPFNLISTDFSRGIGREFMALNGSLYYTMQNRRGVCLYCRNGNREERISPEGTDILHFIISRDGRIFAAGLPELGGAEIYEIYPDRVVQLTAFHESGLGTFDLSRPEHLVFTSSDGSEADGWVVPPANYVPGNKYPAILNIHGGPQLRFYGGFNFAHQVWAADGYFVMYCNPHGSIGDTAQFSNLRKRYGTIDYEDIMKFVDTVLERYEAIDEKRMGVTGISYGGFMTNWIVTRSSRFAAAASQSGIADWISLHATDDLPGFDLTIAGSYPWEDIREHWRISPLAYAGRCSTPTLFIECGEDYRCPVDQGLSLYQALITQGIPSRTVILNGETHCVFRLGRPWARLRIMQEIMEWFDKYIPG